MRTKTKRRVDFSPEHILLWWIHNIDYGVQYYHAMEIDGAVDHGVSNFDYCHTINGNQVYAIGISDGSIIIKQNHDIF